MKKIKKSSYKALSLIFAILSTGNNLHGQSLLGGSLQFAKNATLDDVSIRYCGKTITTQRHEVSIPKITYEISTTNEQTVFHLLITASVPTYSMKKLPTQDILQNTVDYLKINPQEEYLFYTLELVPDEVFDTKEVKNPTYHWVITQSELPSNGQIPDTTIIITYFPGFVKSVKGGSKLELPTIYIDNSIVDLFESQENFEDALIKLQLSSLDLNALHAPTKRKTKSESRRLLIMDTLA